MKILNSLMTTVTTIQIASNKANFLIFVIVDYLFLILICGNTAILCLLQ